MQKLYRKSKFVLISIGRMLTIVFTITNIVFVSLVRRNSYGLRSFSDSLRDMTDFWKSKYQKKDPLSIMYGNYSKEFDTRNEYLLRANAHYQKIPDVKNIDYLLSADEIEDRVAKAIGFSNIGCRFVDSSVTTSIGHMAIALGLRARMRLLDGDSSGHFVILAGSVANSSYLALWEKYFPVLRLTPTQQEITQQILWPLIDNVQTVRRKGISQHLFSAHNSLAREWSDADRAPLLALSPQDIEKGRRLLQSWKIDPQGWFVTIHIRESKIQRPGYGRNAEPRDYIPAIRHIIQSGGTVIRIGGKDSSPLPRMEGFVDTTQFQTPGDWVDIFLLSQCRFLIGTTSGPAVVPQTFGVPVLATNAPALANMIYYPKSIVIPKLVKDANHQFLNLSEILDSPAGLSDAWLEGVDERELIWVDNSPEDILNGVSEMLSASNLTTSPMQERLRVQVMSRGINDTTPISQNFIDSHLEIFNS